MISKIHFTKERIGKCIEGNRKLQVGKTYKILGESDTYVDVDINGYLEEGFFKSRFIISNIIHNDEKLREFYEKDK